MSSEVYVNVNKLREQADHFQNEKGLCDQLYSQIRRVRSLSDTGLDYKYSNLMRKVKALADFYGSMKNAANTVANDAENAIAEIGMKLEDNFVANQKTFTFEHMLVIDEQEY